MDKANYMNTIWVV